jgi:hypothetical protein
MKFKYCFLSLLFALCAPSAWAQAVDSLEKRQFRTLGWEVSLKDLYYEYKGKDVKIAVVHSARSPFYALDAGDTISFYELITAADKPPIRKVVAVADISAAKPWPLIVFRRGGQPGDMFKVSALADDPKSFPFNTCRFINLTEADLYAKYGDEQIKIPARGVESASMKLAATDQAKIRNTMLVALTGDGPLLVYSNNWVVSHNSRVLVFINPAPNGIRVSRIADSAEQYSKP